MFAFPLFVENFAFKSSPSRCVTVRCCKGLFFAYALKMLSSNLTKLVNICASMVGFMDEDELCMGTLM